MLKDFIPNSYFDTCLVALMFMSCIRDFLPEIINLLWFTPLRASTEYLYNECLVLSVHETEGNLKLLTKKF